LIAGLPVQSPVGDGPDFDLMSPSSPALLATPARSADAGQSAVFNFLTPDATGFEQRSLTKKSDSLSQPKKKECPPTPDRLQAVPLKRMSSLHEEKILKAFWGDEPPASMDFTEYRLIGEGAFFQVARVKDKRTGKYYAMKKAKKRFRGKKDREEYLKEVEVLATLKPHENIVRYYQAWQDDGHFYLLMEYCAGNLNELVNQTLSKPPYRIGEDLLLRICRQVAMGLNHIHASNILHLDIKPANILVTSNCTFKLGDFGHSILKKDWKDGHEGDSTYIAPELLSSRLSGVALISPLSGIGPSSPLVMQFSPVSPMASLQGPSPLASPVGGGSAPASPALVNTKADIFSLGLLLFELATGRDLPQNGRLWQKLRQGSDRAALFLKTKSGIDPNFQDLIISMMNPNPLLRPTAARIIELLDLHMPQRQAPAAPAAAAVAPPQ
jgi:membrane-associated tyrosine/threonine-specific cdc2-inhibitory kinase